MKDDVAIKYVTFLVSICFGFARIFVTPGEITPAGSFQAFAHIFVGGIFGAAIALRSYYYFILGIGLSILELTCFLLQQ